MVFSSISFLFFFLPLFLLLDNIIKNNLRNYLLIGASLLFYVWGEAGGVFLLIALCLINMGFGKIIIKCKDNILKINEGGCASLVLAIGVVFNISILIYYKYMVWIVNELSLLIGFDFFHLKDKALPLGISFFTFHAISYLVDVYKGIAKQHSGTDFATYFFMFPHLVAGPIVRFESVRSDIQYRKFDKDLFTYGVFRFIIGVNKKVLIANSVAPLADQAFQAQGTLGMLDAWIGILAYTVQIYFDFSGYSDMAIGLAAMLGIRFDENFRSPYKSYSIKEFWRRWHISLSSWLRDYLFIPLGGSRCSNWINYRNLLIVFIVCGLWHGAQFTFLCWGLFHGGLLILEKTKFGYFIEGLPKFVQRSYCLLMVMIGWVFFRAENLAHTNEYLMALFNITSTSTFYQSYGYLNLLALVIGLAIALFGKSFAREEKSSTYAINTVVYAANTLLFAVAVAVLYTNARNPFIYFNF